MGVYVHIKPTAGLCFVQCLPLADLQFTVNYCITITLDFQDRLLYLNNYAIPEILQKQNKPIILV